MSVGKLTKKSNIHLTRYAQIVKTLVKYGFEDIAYSLKKGSSAVFSRKKLEKEMEGDIKDISRWQRIRMVLEELGTTFIKLGQMLGSRPDLIPVELLEELERLQDLTPTFDSSLAIRLIEENLGKPLDQVFANFDQEALASASIGQVHRAVLHDGKKVIVKVQRPAIQQQIEVDIDILRTLARYAEKYMEEMKLYNPTAIVEALEHTLEQELDYGHEADNIQRFYHHMKRAKREIVVPHVYLEYSSTAVLTMEYIDGFKINNLNAYALHQISPKETAIKFMDSFFEQVFVDGFFHADPHPGNVFVNKEGKLCYLDYGMMGKVADRDKQLLGDLFIAIEVQAPERILQAIKGLAKMDKVENEKGLLLDIELLLNAYYSAELEDIHLSVLVKELRGIILKYRLQIPADFFLLFKALSSMESNVRLLYPDAKLFDSLRPHARKLIMGRVNPFKRLKSVYLSLYDFVELLENFPGDMKKILNKVKQDSFKVEIEHKGLSELRVSLEEISNRISMSILVAAMIIGSSLIVNSKIPPFVQGIPILGLIGFILAVLLGIWLIFSIVRSGKK